MLSIIMTLIVLFLILDFLLFGYVPCFLGRWPSIDKAIREDGGKLHEFKVNTASSNIDDNLSWYLDRYRLHFFSIVLTKDSILVKNTLKTFLVGTRITDVVACRTEKGVFGKRIALDLVISGEKKVLKFKPQDFDNSLNFLSSVGILCKNT
jgi:hypothetical protein